MKKYMLIMAVIISIFSFVFYTKMNSTPNNKSGNNSLIIMERNSLKSNKVVQPHKENKLNKEIKEVQVQKPPVKVVQSTDKVKKNTEVKTAAPQTAAQSASIVQVPVSKLKAGAYSQQLIVITNKSITSYRAACNVYEKVDGQWKYVWKNLNAVTGINGMSYNRHEGDKTSLAGIFTITQAFGIAANPGTKMPYRVVREDDWWAGDSLDPATYNTWQKAPSTGWRESESEHLIDIPLYKYAMAIDFNTARIPYKGAGIFFHIAPYSGGGTLGCIGVKESDLVRIMKWIDPKKNPKIIICPEADLSKF